MTKSVVENDLEISVVIPTRGRPERLESCVASLARQTIGTTEFEVVVVDDGGGDPGVRAIVAAAPPGLSVRTEVTAGDGPAAARNRGANLARGSLLVFTDDDCEAGERWLESMLLASKRNPDAVLGGRTRCGLPENRFSVAAQALVDYCSADTRYFTSNNLAVPSGVFRRLGGFDRRFRRAAGEDRDFCYRAIAEGAELVDVVDAVITHCHALNLRRFVAKNFSYGRGAFQVRRPVGVEKRDRRPFEPFRFYRDLIFGPVNRGVTPERIALSLLMLLAQGANAAGYVWEAWRS